MSQMKYPKVIKASVLFIISIGVLLTSCQGDGAVTENTVLEKMTYETYLSNSKNLYQQGQSVLISFKAEKGALQATDHVRYATQIDVIDMSLDPMEEIEEKTRNLMKMVHEEKRKVLQRIGCSNALSRFDDTFPIPAKINTSKLKGNEENVFHPKKVLMEILAYRNLLVGNLANSHYRYENSEFKKVTYLDILEIKKLKIEKVPEDIPVIKSVVSSAHIDDREGLVDLIYNITPRTEEYRNYSARGALEYLCLLENRILTARKTAFDLFKLRISYYSFGFDKIVPIVSGPDVVKKGQEVELQLMLGAIDSFENPEVTCDQNVYIEVRKGVAYLNFRVNRSTTLTGTLSRRNKQGQMKTINWEKSIEVQQ